MMRMCKPLNYDYCKNFANRQHKLFVKRNTMTRSYMDTHTALCVTWTPILPCVLHGHPYCLVCYMDTHTALGVTWTPILPWVLHGHPYCLGCYMDTHIALCVYMDTHTALGVTWTPILPCVFTWTPILPCVFTFTSCEDRPTLQTPPSLDMTISSVQADLRGYLQN